MPFHDLKPRLDATSEEPVSLQLVRILVREISDGRIRPGEPLPGSRSLAEDLGLTRSAVMTALRELELEGWVESRPASGTYVAESLPATVPRHWGPLPLPERMPEAPAFDMPSQLLPVSSLAMGHLDLSEGWADARLAPKEILAKAYQRALRRHGDDLLARGEPRGNMALREGLAAHLMAQRGMKIGPENLLITRSSGMAHLLLATTLLPGGGHIGVESPGQPYVWEALRSVPGVELHSIPVDGEGLDTAALANTLPGRPLDLVVVTPQRQIPTTVPLSTARRTHLLELAGIHDFGIVEEDPDYDLYGAEGPLVPLAAATASGRVVHLGSLSRALAPGLNLDYLVAPKALVDRLARVRQKLDLPGDRVLEWAVADLIRDGDHDRHLARARQIYAQRLDDFLEALAVDLGFHGLRPSGGLSCWVAVPPDVDQDAWALRCRDLGVRVQPGRQLDLHGRTTHGMRLGFGQLEPGEARRALKKMRSALPAVERRNHA